MRFYGWPVPWTDDELDAQRASRIGAIAAALSEAHNASGGATLETYNGEPYRASRGGFAVGMGRKFGAVLPHRLITPDNVREWLELAFPYDLPPYVGSWYDGTDDTTHLDGVEILPTAAEAAERAQERGERAIWDFAREQEHRLAPPQVA